MLPPPAEPKGPLAFPLTRWSLVGRADDADPRAKRAALSDLLQAYLPALRAHLVHRKRLPPDRADDLLQGFCSDQVLERDLVLKAARDRGRFRTFLLTALERYAINQHHRDAAAKRGPAGGAAMAADDTLEPAAAPGSDPARAFDLAWARQVLDQAVAALRAECAANARPDVWGVFEARVLRPAVDGTEPVGHDELVARLGLRSAADSANLLVTAKRAYARHLKDVVGRYESAEVIEAEVAELKAILARGHGG